MNLEQRSSLQSHSNLHKCFLQTNTRQIAIQNLKVKQTVVNGTVWNKSSKLIGRSKFTVDFGKVAQLNEQFKVQER